MRFSLESFSQVESQRAAVVLGAEHALSEPAIVLFLALISFGVTASDAGFSATETMVSTALLWALPAQLAHAESVAVGAGVFASMSAIVLANLRFFPMVVSLFPQLRPRRTLLNRVGISHLITATSWAWCMDRVGHLRADFRVAYFYGFALSCWLLGLVGTAVGLVLADAMPAWLKAVTLYVAPLYMLLLMAGVRGHRLVALAVGAITGVGLFVWGIEWYLPIAAVLGGTCGFLVRRTV